jgi:positive regulator of sigma E activity
MVGVMAGLKIGKNHFSEPELFAFACGIAGFFIAYLIIRQIAKVLEKNKDYVPKVIRII